jgi:hypothetical protein
MDLVRVRVASFLFFSHNYELEDVYNTVETRLYFRGHPNKTLAQGKVKEIYLKHGFCSSTIISKAKIER